jgi:hypothetical protein
MEKRVKYGMILLMSLIAGLLLYGYFYHISDTSSPLTVKPSISVNASHLIELSNKNEALFNDEYLYKVLSVRGVVRKVKKTRSGITVLLEGSPTLPEVVSCTLDTLYNSREPDLRAGDSCTIQGSCAGCLKDVILLQCIIEK